MPYIPARGDAVWLVFNPQAGHEHAGHRHAIVLSPHNTSRQNVSHHYLPLQRTGELHSLTLPLANGEILTLRRTLKVFSN